MKQVQKLGLSTNPASIIIAESVQNGTVLQPVLSHRLQMRMSDLKMVGKSPEVVTLLEEYGRHKEPVWRQEMIEFLLALGLSPEEAEQKLTAPHAVDLSQDSIH